MDITLPNGTVIRGVPEGTPKHEIAMKAISAGLATNKDFGYEEVEQDKATFLEGIGAGMKNVGARATNLVLPDSLTPDWASDQALQDQQEIDEGLGGMGTFGKVAGEVVATLPMGGGVSAGGKALGRSLLAARRASSIGKAPARVLGKALNSRVGRGAVEGGMFGGLLADPGERGEGVAIGAGFGGGIGAVGRLAGSAGRKFRLTDISDEAKAVQKMTGHFIPLSQSAKPGSVRMLYNALLANMPFVGSKYRQQYQAALDDFRHYAATKAVPDTSHAANLQLTHRTDILRTDSMDVIFQKLEKYWDEAYKPIRAQLVGLTKKKTPVPPDFLPEMVAKIGRGRVVMPTPGVPVKAGVILDLKNLINTNIIPDEKFVGTKNELIQYVKSLDDLIEASFPKGSKFRHVFDEYQTLATPYKNYVDIKSAAAKAASQEVIPGQLAKSAQRGTQNLSASKKSVLQKSAEMGAKTLEDFPSKLGLFQAAAALGLTASAMAGMGAPIAVYTGATAVAKLATTKWFQKLISGQSNHLKKQARKLAIAGYSARQIAVGLKLEEKNSGS